jgi:hypothetical protein
MKTKCGKVRRPAKKTMIDDRAASSDSPQSAFIAIFDPSSDDLWSDVGCDFLFTGNSGDVADRGTL